MSDSIYFFTGSQVVSTSMDRAEKYKFWRSSPYRCLEIMFCKRIVLPEPDGPRITDRKGIFGTISYLDWWDSNSFRAMGFMDGMLFYSHSSII
jgi:hypothetical protein